MEFEGSVPKAGLQSYSNSFDRVNHALEKNKTDNIPPRIFCLAILLLINRYPRAVSTETLTEYDWIGMISIKTPLEGRGDTNISHLRRKRERNAKVFRVELLNLVLLPWLHARKTTLLNENEISQEGKTGGP